MSVKFKPDELVFNRVTKTKTKKVYPIAGVKTSELVKLCTKEDAEFSQNATDIFICQT